MSYYTFIELGLLGCTCVLTYFMTRALRLIIISVRYDIKLKKQILNNK